MHFSNEGGGGGWGMGHGVLHRHEEGLAKVLHATLIEVHAEPSLVVVACRGAATPKGTRSRVAPIRMRTGLFSVESHYVEEADGWFMLVWNGRSLFSASVRWAEVPSMPSVNASSCWTLSL
jgi:hypothetical protein